MVDYPHRASVLVLYSFGDDFGPWLKQPHCRHLLFICILIKWISSNHVSWALVHSESESLGSNISPACLEIVSDPTEEMSGERKKREKWKIYELFISL